MLSKIKKVSIRDVLGVFKFFLVLIPSLVYGAFLRITKSDLWLICEKEDMARDNGVTFFEYVQETHPEIKSYYAINKKSSDYEKVEKYNKYVIQWASLKHYFIYMSATRNISSHKEGNPNHLLFTIMHLFLNMYNNRVFLQHGILKDDAPMFHYKRTKYRLFICGAKPEYDYISKHYGYPRARVVYTGLARFDKLTGDRVNDSIIAFIPTWRRWLNDKNILNSDYRKNILLFLNNKSVEKYLIDSNKWIVFYPHINAQKYFERNDIKNKRVILCKKRDKELSELLCEASLLITDYSSVFFDFAYLKKIVIYYQPDSVSTADGFSKGYFSYEKDAFGPVVTNLDDLIETIKKASSMRFDVEKHKRFFAYRDKNNCSRIYTEILKNEHK